MENQEENKVELRDRRTEIVEAYVHYVLEHGREPVSVFKFVKSLGMKEEEFYEYFTSFASIKSAVWEKIIDDTVRGMESQEVYQEYSAREKMLSFYFTLVEELKKHRSYLLSMYEGHLSFKRNVPMELKGFKEKFKAFSADVILEGKENEEIADRSFISDRYEDALWLETLFILQYWLKDTSPGFEKTDVAIEKSVSLAFDLMGKSALDSFLDLAKFIYQSK
ncbi:TetR/AcrR family transcriptional regulator [Litoribacter alkaliphilus]|uniref:TetR/AcrR family transcriptional regulator n=1 Tax=Litoribacter ruber TaxID=702568 RepID=A0AAP2CM68_9BACT|nr:TetR family transcriptional regulator C-terminal domain-containing protein [Litoribacter alkaliphilus]MBS9525120.1 TetR/AcrR family transcriptional regulator [Litoribacter alkaliphilus]